MHQSTPVSSDAELARALNVDRAVVSRLKRRGMPTGTVEAARAWREANLHPAMRKDSSPERAMVCDRISFTRSLTAVEREQLDRLARLMQVGDVAARVGELELVRAEIQRAMRELPVYLRPAAELSDRVIDALELRHHRAAGEVFAGHRAATALRGPDQALRRHWWALLAAEPAHAQHGLRAAS